MDPWKLNFKIWNLAFCSNGPNNLFCRHRFVSELNKNMV